MIKKNLTNSELYRIWNNTCNNLLLCLESKMFLFYVLLEWLLIHQRIQQQIHHEKNLDQLWYHDLYQEIQWSKNKIYISIKLFWNYIIYLSKYRSITLYNINMQGNIYVITSNPSSFCEMIAFSNAFCFSSLTTFFVLRALLRIGKNAVTFCCLLLDESFMCLTFRLKKIKKLYNGVEA